MAIIKVNINQGYWLPDKDEWHKAAYYKGGGTSSGYWNYATQSDIEPGKVTANSVGDGSAGNSGNFANWGQRAIWNGSSNVTSVGTNGGPSYYGTYDQNGLLWEWTHEIGIFLPSFPNFDPSMANARGGGFFTFSVNRMNRFIGGTPNKDMDVGFRIATINNHLSLNNFVTVGDTGNAPMTFDGINYGSVSYEYQISQYLVTNYEYSEFLNAVAASDTYGLYSTSMSSSISPFVSGGINRSGSNGSYVYSVKTNMGNKPVNWVSWFNALRYCNWLTNGKPIGLQNPQTTENGSYQLYGINDGSVSRSVYKFKTKPI